MARGAMTMNACVAELELEGGWDTLRREHDALAEAWPLLQAEHQRLAADHAQLRQRLHTARADSERMFADNRTAVGRLAAAQHEIARCREEIALRDNYIQYHALRPDARSVWLEEHVKLLGATNRERDEARRVANTLRDQLHADRVLLAHYQNTFGRLEHPLQPNAQGTAGPSTGASSRAEGTSFILSTVRAVPASSSQPAPQSSV